MTNVCRVVVCRGLPMRVCHDVGTEDGQAECDRRKQGLIKTWAGAAGAPRRLSPGSAMAYVARLYAKQLTH